jgi:hypothetical protein
MGSWGTALFSDDVAADVRADWREGILDRIPPEELTAKLVNSYAAQADDPDEGVVFWLALAAAQHETGRLRPDVREKALDILDRGGDVARWEEEDAGLGKQRQQVLDRLRIKLAGPQPAPKHLKRQVPHGVAFSVGDAVLLRSPGGKRAVVVVVGHEPGWPKGTENPVEELLLREDTGELPTQEFMATAPPLYTDSEVPNPVRQGPARIRPNLFSVFTAQKASVFNADIGEVIAQGITRPPAGDYRDGSVMSGEVILSAVQWKWFGVFMDQPRYEAMRELTRTHTRRQSKRWPNLFKKGGLS